MLLCGRKVRLGCIAVLATVLLTSCGKRDEGYVEPVVVQAVDLSIPYSETFSSPENVAIQFQNYVRGGYWEYAYSLMDVPESVLFNCNDLESAEKDLLDIPSDWILYKVSSTNTSVKLSYGCKIGEAYSKAKKDTPAEYLGEVITDTATLTFPLSTEGSKPNMIGVKEDYLTDMQIALRVPDFCDVRIGGKLLDDTSRDDEGYYIISDFVGADYLTVSLSSDIEEKEIVLNLKATPLKNESGRDIASSENDEREYTTETATGYYQGLYAWDYLWDTSRITTDEAMAWVETGIQAVFTSIINGEDYYTGSYQSIMSKNANKEAMKAQYTRVAKNFEEQTHRKYSDLTVVSVTPMDERTMRNRGVGFRVIDRHTMSTWVSVSYTYVVLDKRTGEQSVKTGTVEGEVDLSKDDGEWRLMNISDRLLKGM